MTPLVDEATWERAQEQLDAQQADGATQHASASICCAGSSSALVRPALDRTLQEPPRPRLLPLPDDRGRAVADRLHRAVRDRTDPAGIRRAGAVKAFLLDPETRAAGVGGRAGAVATERRTPRRRSRHHRPAASPTCDRQLGTLLDEALTDGFPAEIIDRRKRDLLAERKRRAPGAGAGLGAARRDRRPDIEAAVAALVPTVEQAFATATPAELRRLLDLLRVEVHPVDRHSARLTGVIGGPDGSVVTLLSG